MPDPVTGSMFLRNATRRAAWLVLLVAFVFSGTSLYAQQAVIPPGQEALLESNLSPDATHLPQGATLEGMGISHGEVSLQFRFTDGRTAGATVAYNGDQPLSAGCAKAGPLRVCAPDLPPDWLNAYAAWLVQSDKAVRAQAAWSVTARPQVSETQADSPQARAYTPPPKSLSALFMLALALVVALVLFGRRKRAARSEQALGVALVAGLSGEAAMLWAALGGAAPILWGATVAIVAAILAGLMLLNAGQRGALWPGFGRRDAFWLGLPFMMLALALLFVAGAPLVADSLRPLIARLNRPFFSEPGFRAALTVWYHGSLWLLALIVLWRALNGQRRAVARSAAALLGFALAAGAVVLVLYGNYLQRLHPDSIWVEFQPVLALALGKLPLFPQYLHGSAGIAAPLLVLFGGDVDGVTAVRSIALFGWIAALVLATRRLVGGWLAVLAVAALGVVYPLMVQLITEGWWFMLGAAAILATLAALHRAYTTREAAWGWLALLLMHLAFELRLEAVVLFGLWIVWRGCCGRLSRRLDRIAALVIGVDLVRLMMLGANSGRVGSDIGHHVTAYAGLLAELWPVLALAVFGLWRLARRQFASALLLVLSFGGLFAVYATAATVPSQREVLLLASPLVVLAAAAFGPPAPNRHRLVSGLWRLGLLVGGLVVVVWLSAPTRMEWRGWQERAQARGQALAAELERMPRDLPLLLDPTYLELIAPERVRLLNSPAEIEAAQLRRALKRYSEALCINDLGRTDICCYYEIDPGPLDADADDDVKSGRCFPLAAIGYQATRLNDDGPITVLRLRRLDSNED